MPEPNLIRIVVVDDHPLVIGGLKILLTHDPQIRIVASFTGGQAVLDFLETTAADVILLDVSLPDIGGAEVSQRIRTHYPATRVLGLSTYGEPSVVNRMMKHQANGYLLKSVTADELVRAIHQVHRGQSYFSAEVQQALDRAALKQNLDIPRLTRREKEIVRLVADGQTTQQIADRLFISPLTVETHRRNLMKKMNVSNAASLIKLVLDHAII